MTERDPTSTPALPGGLPFDASQIQFTQATVYPAGTLGAHAQSIISVKDAPFNAQGDGVTDDTAAIAAAIAAVASGGTVWFPAGTYKITSAIALNRAVTLRGDGRSSIIQQTSASSANVVTVTAAFSRIENIKLLGNSVGGGGAGAENIVYVAAADDVTVAYCWLENGSLTGLRCAGDCKRLRVLYNRVTGTNPNSANSNSADINIDFGVHEDPWIIGNQCISTLKCMGILIQPPGNGDIVRRAKVLDNLVQTCVQSAGTVGHGIVLYSGGGTATVEHPEVCNNHIQSCQGIGIYLRGVSTGPIIDPIIANNHLVSTMTIGTAGSLEDGAISLVDAPRGRIVGNQIITGGASGSTSSGIRVHENCQSSLIANNVIYGFLGAGIKTLDTGSGSSTELVISGNHIISGGGVSISSGIFINHGTDNSRIVNNVIDTPTADGVVLQGAAASNNILIEGNVTKSCVNGINLNNASVVRAKVIYNTDVTSTTPIRNGGAVSPYFRGNQMSTGASQGRAVMVNGTVTVNTAEIQAADNVLLTRVVGTATTRGILTVGTIVAGTSFVIRAEDLAGALSADDDSTVFWEIVH